MPTVTVTPANSSVSLTGNCACLMFDILNSPCNLWYSKSPLLWLTQMLLVTTTRQVSTVIGLSTVLLSQVSG